jgi:hypothetical protein
MIKQNKELLHFLKFLDLGSDIFFLSRTVLFTATGKLTSAYSSSPPTPHTHDPATAPRFRRFRIEILK